MPTFLKFLTALRAVKDVPENDGKGFSPLDLSTWAVSALIEEAELTPKPALVDRGRNGAHRDLDLAKLRRSARALEDGFTAIAETAWEKATSIRLREHVGSIGRAMERKMMDATDGSNAHRGAIWSVGLVVAAAAQRHPDGSAAGIAAAAGVLARLPDRFAPYPLSHGARARFKFGVAGARGEAQSGFPNVILVGLPALRSAREGGAPEDRARLDALMALMSSVDDTCLLHRGGRAALEAAQEGARAVIAAGGTASRDGLHRLYRLDAKLMSLWASPGGSADLLSVTLFLDSVERGTRALAGATKAAPAATRACSR